MRVPRRRRGSTMAEKRGTLEPRSGNKRYMRRGRGGRFGNQVGTARSLASDRRRTARSKVPSGQGDKGDRAATRAMRRSNASKGRKAAGARARRGEGVV